MRLAINRKEIQAMAGLVDNFQTYVNLVNAHVGEPISQSEDGRSQLQKAEDWINNKLGKTLGESTKIAKVSVTLTGHLAIDINPSFIKEGLELYGMMIMSIAEPVGQITKTLMGSAPKIETFVEKWNTKYVPEEDEVMESLEGLSEEQDTPEESSKNHIYHTNFMIRCYEEGMIHLCQFENSNLCGREIKYWEHLYENAESTVRNIIWEAFIACHSE